MSESSIETLNEQLVCIIKKQVTIMKPKNIMTPEEAKRHAAWLVTMADMADPETPAFGDILEAVENT